MRLAFLFLGLMLTPIPLFAQSDNAIACSADGRWLNTNGSITYSTKSQAPISLSLIAHVNGLNCRTSEIAVSATYLTESQEMICSGTVYGAMSMNTAVHTFNMEIRPFTQLDFVRWRNQPGIRGIQQGKRLTCFNIDGTSDLGDTDRAKAAWVRLSIAVFPVGGGLSVTEALIRVTP
jgi:hypothetical protein